jgi:NADH-quinone oxidoreductase subunit K
MFHELHYLVALTCVLFSIGLTGIIVNRKNVLMILLSIEILLLAVNLNFATISIYLDDLTGHIFVIFILTIAAAESAVGLSLITCLYKIKGNFEITHTKKKFTKI